MRMQAATAPEPLSLRLQSLGLTTRDLGRAKAFYCGKLGLPVVEETSGRLTLDAGGVRIAVVLDGARPPLGHVEPKLSFHVDALMHRCMVLRDRGVSVDGPLVAEGPNGSTRRYAELSDPDGHPIVMYEASADGALQ